MDFDRTHTCEEPVYISSAAPSPLPVPLTSPVPLFKAHAVPALIDDSTVNEFEGGTSPLDDDDPVVQYFLVNLTTTMRPLTEP